VDDGRHDRHAATGGGNEGADVESLQTLVLVERAFRKEHQRVPLFGPLHDAPCSAVTPPVGAAVDELGADPFQDHADHRHRGCLALDDEREPRRQGCLEHDAVEVARMIRGHDAAFVRQVRESAGCHPQPEDREGDSREPPDEAATPFQAGQGQHQDCGDHEQQAEDGERADAVQRPERARQRSKHRWGTSGGAGSLICCPHSVNWFRLC